MSIKDLLKECVPPAAIRVSKLLLKLPRSSPEPAPTKEYRIGAVSLLLPHDHALPLNRSTWKLYDTPIQLVADGLRRIVPDFRILDVGANVGNTAACLASSASAAPTPTLCIEGDPAYIPFLQHNAKAIGSHIFTENCFVGEAEGWADVQKLDRHDGTTSAVRAIGAGNPAGVPVHRLETILQKHPAFAASQLIKIDTDGYDFRIILSHLPFLTARKPVLFYENTVDSHEAQQQSLACLDALMQAGYKHFLVFDNFGNFVLSTTSKETLRDLNAYLLSHAVFSTAVYYCDICAIPDAYADLVELVREMVSARIAVPS